MRGAPAAAAAQEAALEVSFADLAARYEDDDGAEDAAAEPSTAAGTPAPQAPVPEGSGAVQPAAAPAPEEEEQEGLDEWDSDDDYYPGDDFLAERGTGGSAIVSKAGARKLQPLSNDMQRLDSKVRLGLIERRAAAEEHMWEPENMAMDNSVRTALRQNTDKQLVGRSRTKDRADRATVQTVLDDRTRMVLFKMLEKGVFSEIHGCISTGKEANVYHAVTAVGADLAVKVYKTSILVFKDRDRYVSGDPRFTSSYQKGNPRQMVAKWAEKENRNLLRLHAAGIRCPRPHLQKLHVLVMDFIGVDGVAALRLKDARLPVSRLQSMYTEMVLLVRKLYQECRLVHGDLSEYNILVNQGELYIIDVSQAVDLNHPRALDFLREDAAHVNAFFRRAGIAALTTRELFDFVVDPNIHAGNVQQALDRLAAAAATRPAAAAAEEETADNVFVQTHVPRALEEVADHEAHFDRLAKGEDVEGIYYQTITGMRHDMTGARQGPAFAEAVDEEAAPAAVPLEQAADGGSREAGEGGPPGSEASSSVSKESSSGSSDNESEDEGEGGRARAPVDPEAAKAAKKQHKREVKEAKRERRKTKIPKHVKKKHARKKR